MDTSQKKYEMRVTQININNFKLMLVVKGMVDQVVYETLSNTIPLTQELINRYQQKRSIH